MSLIIFILMDAAPGSIIDSLINEEMTQEDIAALRKQYDLDKPCSTGTGNTCWGCSAAIWEIADLRPVRV